MKDKTRLKIEQLKEIKNYTPSQVNDALDELSRTYAPKCVEWTLNIDKEYSSEKAAKNALLMVSKLKIYTDAIEDKDEDEIEVAQALNYKVTRMNA